MNKFLIVLIAQYVLLLVSYVLIPIYVKNPGRYLLGGLSKKAVPVYAVGIVLTLASLGYLVYFCSHAEISDDSDQRNKLFLTSYFFLAALCSILLIFYAMYKNNKLYYLIKVVLYLTAAFALALLGNIWYDGVYDIHEKVAVASAAIISAQSLIGDAMVWSWYFPK